MAQMQPKMIDKFLIILPFWEGDKGKMAKLARLLADLKPSHSKLADILFVARFDCEHDDRLVQYVSRKFNVHKHKSMRQGTGWPFGCNSLWFGSVEWCYHMMVSRKVPHYRALINMEADCVPVRKDWLQVLREQWIAVSSKKPVAMAGDIVVAGGREHINANAILSGDLKFLKWMALVASTHEKPAGWDWYLAGDIQRWGWAKLPGVRSWWNTPTFTEADWEREQREGTAIFHGVKDESLHDLARKKLIG